MHILTVNDQALIQHAMKGLVNTLGISATWDNANSLQQAEALLDQGSPDLVLVDLDMRAPVMRWLEHCQHQRPGLPLALMGSFPPGDLAAAQQHPALVAVLPKDADLATLCRSLESALGLNSALH